jgi:hypothetical protein
LFTLKLSKSTNLWKVFSYVQGFISPLWDILLAISKSQVLWRSTLLSKTLIFVFKLKFLYNTIWILSWSEIFPEVNIKLWNFCWSLQLTFILKFGWEDLPIISLSIMEYPLCLYSGNKSTGNSTGFTHKFSNQRIPRT